MKPFFNTTNRRYIIYILLIIFLYFLVMAFLQNRGIKGYGCYLSIGGFFYILMGVFPFFLMQQKSVFQKIWIVIMVGTLLDLPFLMFKVNAVPVNYDLIWPWELFLILIATGNIFFLYKTAPRKINVSSKDLSLVFIAAILCILVFQTSNQIMYLLKVANESRSTFIYGLELHHINYGILGAVFLPGLYRIFYFKKYMKPVLLILAGVFYGMIWDEWLYYMYKDVSDEAYMSHQTYLSAIFCVAVSYFCWLCFLEWTDTKNQT